MPQTCVRHGDGCHMMVVTCMSLPIIFPRGGWNTLTYSPTRIWTIIRNRGLLRWFNSVLLHGSGDHLGLVRFFYIGLDTTLDFYVSTTSVWTSPSTSTFLVHGFGPRHYGPPRWLGRNPYAATLLKWICPTYIRCWLLEH